MITSSKTTTSQPDHLPANDRSTTTSGMQSVDNNSITTLDSSLINETIEKRPYKPRYSQKFPWLIYQPNLGGFCNICRNYWKPGISLFKEMEQKTKGAFTSTPFVNWKQATGENGRLMKHSRSEYHLIAIDNEKFRQQEGSILNQLVTVSETQKENRDRLGDLIDCGYFLFKNELPHTTLYNSLLQLVTRLGHSSKLADFLKIVERMPLITVLGMHRY